MARSNEENPVSIIPEELLEQLERGNVLLIGEGINQGILPSSQIY